MKLDLRKDFNTISKHVQQRVRDYPVYVNTGPGEDAPATNQTDGIMVSRPITHPHLLRRVFRVMELGDVMLFYSDETTPILVDGADSGQYPDDLLEVLGKPRYVNAPSDLLHQT